MDTIHDNSSGKKYTKTQSTVEQINHHTRGLYLPIINPSSIFGSRSLNNRSIIIGSIQSPVKNLFKQQKIFNNNKKQKKKRTSQSITEIKNNQQEAKSKKKMTARRIQTDPKQVEQLQNTQTFNLKKKISVADKLLKIAQQLGMNQVDYQSYMKTQRKVQAKVINLSQNKIKQANNKVNILSTSQNLHVIKNTEKKKKYFTQTKNNEKKQDEKQKQQYIMSALKCNLKLKPMPRTLKKNEFFEKQIKQRKRKRDQSQLFNKSIRGWTKYGKIQEQILY